MSQVYEVKLDTFEGPLDLLLHLIDQLEIDIYDIPVAEITTQYLNFVHTMQHLELNIASEYLVMAATLISIKSQMLLPKQQITDEIDAYEEDPREELMQRLIEYQKFKKAANSLEEREAESNQIFTRSPSVFEEVPENEPVVRGDISIYDMIGALNNLFKRKEWDRPLDTKITRMEIPLEQRMADLLNVVRHSKQGIAFEDLFSYRSKSQIVITFIALLELLKSNDVYCKQTKHFSALYIYHQR